MDLNFEPLTSEEQAEAPKIADFEEMKVPIVPVPEAALPLSFKHPVYGRPTEAFEYSNAEGQLVGYMAYFGDTDGNKHTYPLTYCRYGSNEGWRAEGFPKPCPLFNLPEVIARPDVPVLVVRGEHNVEAAKLLLPQFVATTSPSDDGQIGHADWTALKGRNVFVLTHADGREKSFISSVATYAYKGGAKSVAAIPASSLAKFVWLDSVKAHRTIIPTNWDVAKAVEEGWTAETFAQEIGDLSLLEPEPKPLVFDAYGNACFQLGKHGVEAWVVTAKNEYWLPICGPLEMIATARTPDNDGWTDVFCLTNADGKMVDVDLPRTLLAGDGVKLREILHDHGLFVETSKLARECLLEFIAKSSAQDRYIRVNSVGWFDDVFVTGNGVIGQHSSGDDIRYISEGGSSNIGKLGGTQEQWCQLVARPCQGNSRLVFAISAALCGPLLKLGKAESTIFHFVGQSSKGKTTALAVASSVWGGGGGKFNIGNWRATANGLEWAAMAHNDALMCLDEIGQIKGGELGQAAYMLTNGTGKKRARRSGGLQPVATWQMIVLSSGEVDLETKVREDDPRRHVTAGQQVRLIDISADAGKAFGLFESLNDFTSARAMAEGLGRAAIANYGYAGTNFVELVSRDTKKVAALIDTQMAKALKDLNLSTEADGQVARVAKKFMLVGVAGELAITFGILPWSVGEAQAAARQLFDEWLKNRGGIGATEELHALEHIRYYLQKNARWFTSPEQDQDAPRSAASSGFIKDISGEKCFCFPVDTWKRDVCAGLDARFVAHVLDTHGFLAIDIDRKTKSVSFNGSTIKVYAIKQAILTVASDGLSLDFKNLFEARSNQTR